MTGNTESVLLDTSVWIDVLRGKTSGIVAITQELLNDDRVLTCGPVMFEIKRGLRPPERNKILPLFDALIRLSVDETIKHTTTEPLMLSSWAFSIQSPVCPP